MMGSIVGLHTLGGYGIKGKGPVMSHVAEEKQKLLNRLKRLRGQIDALERAPAGGDEPAPVLLSSVQAEALGLHPGDPLELVATDRFGLPRGARARDSTPAAASPAASPRRSPPSHAGR